MTALAEALVAAQRRALTAMEKAYVAGAHTDAQMIERMDEIGATEKVDQDRLIAALRVIRDLGASLPAEPQADGEPKAPARASEAQLSLIKSIAAAKHVTPPEVPLTKEQAHEVIDTLKAGTYDQGKWVIPF